MPFFRLRLKCQLIEAFLVAFIKRQSLTEKAARRFRSAVNSPFGKHLTRILLLCLLLQSLIVGEGLAPPVSTYMMNGILMVETVIHYTQWNSDCQ